VPEPLSVIGAAYYQWVLPISHLKHQLPTDEDFLGLTHAVRDALRNPRLKEESVSLACQGLKSWGFDLDPDHRIWAFSVFSTLFEEAGLEEGNLDGETANVIAEWTARFMHEDYNENTCFIIADTIRKAILEIGPSGEAETVLNALRIGSIQQRNETDAADWTNDSVIRSLQRLLTFPN